MEKTDDMKAADQALLHNTAFYARGVEVNNGLVTEYVKEIQKEKPKIWELRKKLKAAENDYAKQKFKVEKYLDAKEIVMKRFKFYERKLKVSSENLVAVGNIVVESALDLYTLNRVIDSRVPFFLNAKFPSEEFVQLPINSAMEESEGVYFGYLRTRLNKGLNKLPSDADEKLSDILLSSSSDENRDKAQEDVTKDQEDDDQNRKKRERNKKRNARRKRKAEEEAAASVTCMENESAVSLFRRRGLVKYFPLEEVRRKLYFPSTLMRLLNDTQLFKDT